MTKPVPTMPRSSMIYNAASKSATLYIYGTIGPGWWDEGITGKSFDRQLKSFGSVDTIDVWIDSSGGSAFDGIAIYNTLNEHSAKKIMHVIARACSAASVVLMAGDEIHIAENAFVMIHNASAFVDGTAADMRKQADLLEALNKSVVETYAARTKLDATVITKMMDDETWMDAKTAKDKGFATHIVPNKAVAMQAKGLPLNVASLANYKHVPDWVAQSLLNLEKESLMAGESKEPAPPPANPNLVELKAGFTYRLGDDGKMISEPIKPAPAPAPAPTAQTTDVNAIVENAVNVALEVANKRYRDITALCARAGVPQMADGFLADPKVKVENVQTALLDVLIAKNVPLPPGGANSDASGTSGGDPTAKWKAEYQAAKKVHEMMGVTEEEYVNSMQLSAGMPVK